MSSLRALNLAIGSVASHKFALAPTVNQVLKGKLGNDYQVSGWIKAIRKQKTHIFAEVSDGSTASTIQVVLPAELIRDPTVLSLGSSIQVQGKLAESLGRGQAIELLASEVLSVGPCPGDSYPIHKNEMSEAYLRNQALSFRLRTEKFSSLSRLKSQISNLIHRILNDNEFIQIYPPIITEHDCEGGGETFRIEANKENFFSKPAFLTVSTQLHLEMAAASLQRVYSFSPVFRAENQQTTKHLSEFWMLECEMAFLEDLKSLLGTIEFFIQSCCDGILQLSGPIPSISYTDAVRELSSVNNCATAGTTMFEYPVYWGADLKTEHERYLAEQVFKGPVFVTDYPAQLKPFYMKLNPDERTVACCDLLVPGVGEVVGGSLREDRFDVLKARMDSILGRGHNLDWYLDLRKYGGTRHGGFGLGFDRLIQFLSGAPNIRDVVMIPRFCGSIKF